MGDFFGILCVVAATIWFTSEATVYTFDAKETHELLTEVCKKNGGVVSSKISVDSWKFECTDGAVFKVDR